MNKNIGIINIVIFTLIILLMIFKFAFPVITFPVGAVPMIHHPFPVSLSTIINIVLLVVALTVNVISLAKDEKTITQIMMKKIIIIVAAVLIPCTSWAQNSIISTEFDNNDSLCRKDVNAASDTASIKKDIRYNLNTNVSTGQKHQEQQLDTSLLNFPKYNAFTEKLKDMQIANNIRGHVK